MARSPREQAALDEAMAAFEGDALILVVLRDPKGGILDVMSLHGRARPDAQCAIILEPLLRRLADEIKEVWKEAGIDAELKDR